MELLCDSVKIHKVNVEPQVGEEKVRSFLLLFLQIASDIEMYFLIFHIYLTKFYFGFCLYHSSPVKHETLAILGSYQFDQGEA